jgi:hypothetical protein
MIKFRQFVEYGCSNNIQAIILLIYMTELSAEAGELQDHLLTSYIELFQSGSWDSRLREIGTYCPLFTYLELEVIMKTSLCVAVRSRHQLVVRSGGTNFMKYELGSTWRSVVRLSYFGVV